MKKMTFFSDVAPCGRVEIERRVRGAYCLHHQGDRPAESTSETSVNLYETTRRNIRESGHLQQQHILLLLCIKLEYDAQI
jgi:hypothetical protein